jgi:hypothetical protein
MVLKIVALASVMLALTVAVTGHQVPPCQAEDGGPYPCVWDGPSRGNRMGDRVIVSRD